MTIELPVAPLAELRHRRSAKWRTYPPDVLALTVAEMDFDLAAPIAAALREAVECSDTGYAMPVPELGAALADFAAARWNWPIDAAAVSAVPDVGVGVVELLRVLTWPGEAVALSPPVYPPFFSWVPESGARIVEVPLAAGRLDLAALQRTFAERPAVYLLCNPHNPVGRVHDADELADLAALAGRYEVTIVSDEIHAPLTLPGAQFTPFLTVPGAAEVGVSLLSASKTWNLAGLKCAAIVTASARMARVVERLPDDVRWRLGHFGVLATVAAFRDGTSWLEQLLLTLDRRRAQLDRLLRDRLPGVRWQSPQATFLAWLDCRETGLADPAKRFLAEGVALEPGPRFGAAGAGYVRLNFATSADILDDAITRLSRAIAAPPAAPR